MSDLPTYKTKIRWGDWLTAILLVIIMQIASARLVATHWTKELQLVQVIAFLGTILGLTLGKSIFNRFWVFIFTLAYGSIIIPWQIGLTLDPEIFWRERLINIWGRLQFIVRDLIIRKPVTDNLLFLSLMAMLFWVLTIYAGYILVREGNPWKTIIPAGIAAFVIHSFDPLLVSRSWYLAFYLFFALLLLARLVFLKNTVKWRDDRTHTPPDVGFDISRMALILSVILVFFAWNVPVVAETFKPAADIWRTASKPWFTTKDRLSFMFASLRASVGLVQNFYGETLQLGLGSPLSDQVVMEVEAPTFSPNGDQFYWEARTYTTYENNQWLTTISAAHNLTPESVDINQPGANLRQVVSFTFFPYSPISNIYAVPEPLWANLPTQAYMDITPDGMVNFGALMSRGFVRPGEQYVIRSAIDDLTIIELENAGTSYPQWVLDEYLQLPNDITSRTKELARDIATDFNNPYDIAYAVTEYLRNNIKYNQSITKPPSSQERIDWFLFDYQEGFCNYYASAEVVLLRSLGIPARLAVGFAQGEREEHPAEQQLPAGISVDVTQEELSEASTYIVRHKDAHAWPEVYFPEIGWIIFEPTASQPVVIRPSGETDFVPFAERRIPQEDSGEDQLLNNPNQQRPGDNAPESDPGLAANFWTFGNIVKLILLLIAVALLVIVIWRVQRGFKVKPFLVRISIELPVGIEKGLRSLGIRPPGFLVNWIYLVRLPVLSRSYLEINHALARIGKKPASQDTPSERTDHLIESIPSTMDPAKRLLAEYQTSVYSQHRANSRIAQKAGAEIRKLSWLAWLGRLTDRF